MQLIDTAALLPALSAMEGRRVWLHFEFARGGFCRNLTAMVAEAHVRGEGPYRAALRCEGDGWVIMEELTHMELAPGGGLIFLCALDEEQRLGRALQISREPFAP